MYMLRQRILSTADLVDDSTFRFKLPSVGKFTAIQMTVNADRYADGADNDTCYPLESCIDKIELVAGGSKTLLSLTGKQLDAMNYWAFGKPTPRRHRNRANMDNMLNLYLLGGRNLYDQEYGWDLGKLPETYLEYTYDLSEGVAEYFKADTHDLKLYIWRWMGPGSPDFKGYFRSRQLAAWATTGASVIKTVGLPVGNPYRWVGVQAKTRGQTIGGTITEMELKVNNGEYSPVHIPSPMDFVMQEVAEYSLDNIISGMEYCVQDTIYDMPTYFSYYDSIDVTAYQHDPEDFWLYSMIGLPPRVEESGTSNMEYTFTQRGWGFQKCLRIGFDHLADGADLLYTRGMGALDLDLTEQTSGEDAAVFAQDIVAY